MVKIILLLLFSIGIKAQSLDQIKNAVVKIKSYPCIYKSPVFEGSGFVTEIAGEKIVLTSEHILMPQNLNKVCMTASNEYIGEVEVALRKNSFEHGLAILKFNQDLNIQPIELKSASSEGQDIIILGYPANSHSLQILSDGKLITKTSTRSLIPALESIIEISHLPVEFGMSGGLVVQKNNRAYSFIGMLSHQYLKREAGRSTSIETRSRKSDTSSNDLTLAISSSDIKRWSNQERDDEVRFVRSLNHRNQINIELGPLVFEKITLDSAILNRGGADGTGIGGDGVSENENGITAIKISLNSSDELKRTIEKINSPLIKRWYHWLLQGQELYIIQMTNQSGDESISLSSFDQLITLWLRDQYTPLVFRGDVSQIDARIQSILNQADKVKMILSRIDENNYDLSLWRKSLYNKLLILESSLTFTLEEFNSKNSPRYWQYLYNYDFDLALELEIELEQLEKLFR
jgi:hypothetical protein